MEFYQKNPSALASLKGNVYEDKIINLIKNKAKSNKKNITKEEAEKILKEAHKHDHEHIHDHSDTKIKETKADKITTKKKIAKSADLKKKIKKVSKK